MIKAAGQWARGGFAAAAVALGTAAWGAGTASADRAADSTGTEPSTSSHDGGSLIPQRLVWPGVVVIVVIAVFVTAALAGPVIRANLMDDDPDDGSTDASG